MAAVGNEWAGQRIQNGGGGQREGIICGQYIQSMDKRPVWCWDLAQRRSWWGDKWEGKRRSHQEGKIETHTPKGAKVDLVNVCWCSTGQNKSQEWVWRAGTVFPEVMLKGQIPGARECGNLEMFPSQSSRWLPLLPAWFLLSCSYMQYVSSPKPHRISKALSGPCSYCNSPNTDNILVSTMKNS